MKQKLQNKAQNEYYSLEAVDITGTNVISISGLNPSTSAENLAAMLASRLRLPANTPWMLRHDATGAFLSEKDAIGDQIEKTGDRVVLSPKAHLGLSI